MAITIVSYLSEMALLHGKEGFGAAGLTVPDTINPLAVSPLPLEQACDSGADAIAFRASEVARGFQGEYLVYVETAIVPPIVRSEAERIAVDRIRSESRRPVPAVQLDLGRSYSHCWLFLCRVHTWAFPAGYGVVVDHRTRRAFLRSHSGAIAVLRARASRLSAVVTSLDGDCAHLSTTAAPPPSLDGDAMVLALELVPRDLRVPGATFDVLVDDEEKILRVLRCDEEG